MSKKPFTYRVDERGRTLRIALSRLVTKKKRGRFMSEDRKAAVDFVRVTERKWKKDHGQKSLPDNFRDDLIGWLARTAWNEECDFEERRLRNRLKREGRSADAIEAEVKKWQRNEDVKLRQQEFEDAFKVQLHTAVETTRKNASKPRKFG